VLFCFNNQSNDFRMKNKTIMTITFAFFTHYLLLAQLPYTQKQYPVFVEKDIPYGMAISFAGGTESLVLDLYKPIGDENCQRPLLIMAHGGGFIAGDRHNYDVVQICQEMAERGYVTASIEYRLGMHPLAFYEPYALCNDAINPVGISKCIYMADTLEFYRGMYRATQDLRGAIRFLKGRHELDSTDVHNVFIGGSSAGGITALQTAIIDLPSERPPFTAAIADAPMPDADLNSCIPTQANRSRPDLGPIEGDLNLNGHDASVQGVAGFMGAVFNLGSLSGDTPPLYLYHRTDDLVVPSNSAQLFGLYPFCLNPINLCQPLYTRPWASGSSAIADELVQMGGAAPPFFNDVLTNYGPANGDDCFDDPPGHSIENIPLRCENLSGFFAPIIVASGNNPTGNCVSGVGEKLRSNDLLIFPNPINNEVLNLHCAHCPEGATLYQLLDGKGRVVALARGNGKQFRWEMDGLPSGLYFVRVLMENGWSATRTAIIE
jgi:acetyl esterase/lipase